MKLLEPRDYRFLQALVADSEHDLAVRAIVAGDAIGKVYADRMLDPRLALVSPHWGRLYVIGRPRQEAALALRALIESAIRPAALADGAEVFTIMYPSDWNAYMGEALAETRAVSGERQYYRWATGRVELVPLPDGFTLVAADERLLTQEIANLRLLTEEMTSERTSVADFLSRSFGVVALRGNELAGWCLSEYNTNGRCEVGIAALEPFQRCGLATAMGRAFLDVAPGQGIREVGWHCWKKNLPSVAAARRIGLEWITDYPVYFGWYGESEAPA